MAPGRGVPRAILHRPRIPLLGEPAAGLDPQSRIALWEILAELHAAGQTILLTTHYMEEAQHLCDRVAIMDHGRIVALDTPRALIRAHAPKTTVAVTMGDGVIAFASLPGVQTVEQANGEVMLSTSDPLQTVHAF